jgi:fumarate hydratase class II
MTATRTESDSFGPLEVPTDKYWGAQTQRSIMNFPIGWENSPWPSSARWVSSSAPVRRPTRRAASWTRAGRRHHRAAQEVIDGKLDDNFPLVVWQTGPARSRT